MASSCFTLASFPAAIAVPRSEVPSRALTASRCLRKACNLPHQRLSIQKSSGLFSAAGLTPLTKKLVALAVNQPTQLVLSDSRDEDAQVAMAPIPKPMVAPTSNTASSSPSPEWEDFVRASKPVLKMAAIVGLSIAFNAAATGSSLAAASQELLEFQAKTKVGMDTVWVLFCAYLVIFMNAGFALVESGMCRAKNTVNILAKNLIIFALAVTAFYATGFGLLFGNGNSFSGTTGFFLQGAGLDNAPATLLGSTYQGPFQSMAGTSIPISAKFFFQSAFASTAATIVSGAVAERIKFFSFCAFSILLVALSYPITGHWIWGGGWLAQFGFFDFAGCTTVHSVGGWAALVGAALLGPRIGRFPDSRGRQTAMPPSNYALATLGCLILWLCWFGFNPGSTMAVDADAIAHIAMTTNFGACAGALAASAIDFFKRRDGKVDLSMIINGVLGGLVGVTAACPWVTVPNAAIIGAVGGAVAVYCIDLFNNMKIDDPVSAISVHLGGGIWGTLAVGLFCEGPGKLYAEGPARGLLLGGEPTQLLTQVMGILCVGGFTVAFSLLAWLVVKALFGLRVSSSEELEGLDLGEHGQVAYVDLEPARTVGVGVHPSSKLMG